MRTTLRRAGWLLLLLACLLPVACQSHRQKAAQRAAATLSGLNLAATLDLSREKNGAAPPRRFPTWVAYWQRHFATLHIAPPGRDRDTGAWREVAGLHLAFVKQKRAELGLPPFD